MHHVLKERAFRVFAVETSEMEVSVEKVVLFNCLGAETAVSAVERPLFWRSLHIFINFNFSFY